MSVCDISIYLFVKGTDIFLITAWGLGLSYEIFLALDNMASTIDIARKFLGNPSLLQHRSVVKW